MELSKPQQIILLLPSANGLLFLSIGGRPDDTLW